MRTVNGKLINQDSQNSEQIKTRLEHIFQDIRKLEPVLGQHNQQMKSVILALKYLEQRMNSIEQARLNSLNSINSLNSSLSTLERKVSQKLIAIATVSVVGLASLWGWFFVNHEPSHSPVEKKAESVLLIDQDFS